MEATGHCQVCQSPITFAAEDAGHIAVCPACNRETILTLPAKAQRRVPRPVPAAPRPKVLIEDTLDEIGRVFLVCGLVGALILGALMCFFFSEGSPGPAFGLAIGALVSAGQGFIVQAVFRALAEIIRLLRRQS